MPKPVPEEELKAIEDVLKAHTDGASRLFIVEALSKEVAPRTFNLACTILSRTDG